jgi:death-on-curing protein
MLHEESLSEHGGGRGVRDMGLLESAMMRPQNLASYNQDADIAALAASYAYGLAKNHPFVDGNKRAAFLSVGLFLGINGYSLTASPIDAIQAVLALAGGDMTEDEFAQWVGTNMASLSTQ